jgi:hypothetical protein
MHKKCFKHSHKYSYVTFIQEICQIYSSSLQFMYFYVFYLNGTLLIENQGKSSKTTKCN